jgi:hypothetical protein
MADRDEFLALMIAELGAQGAGQALGAGLAGGLGGGGGAGGLGGGGGAGGLGGGGGALSLEEVLRKFRFDFPLLAEEHVAQLAAFVRTLRPHSASGGVSEGVSEGGSGVLSPQFLENVRYVSQSPSHAGSRAVPELCAAVYVSLPLACLHMTAPELRGVFPSEPCAAGTAEASAEAVLGSALRQLLTLIRASTPALLLHSGKAGSDSELCAATAQDLSELVCQFLNILAAPKSSCGESLQDFLSVQVAAECGQSSVGTNGDDWVSSAVVDMLTHLMYLVRDMVLLSPVLYSSLVAPVVTATLSTVSGISRAPRRKKKDLSADPLESIMDLRAVLNRQAHMLLFHIIAQISTSFYGKFSLSPMKRTNGQSAAAIAPLHADGGYGSLILSLRANSAGIVFIVESIKKSLLAEAADNTNYSAAMANVLSSLTSIGIVLLESCYSGNKGEIEDLFFGSQLLPLLIRTAFEQQSGSEGGLLYTLVSNETRRQLLFLLAGLALLPTSNGSRPFADFICQSAFSVLCSKEASLHSEVESDRTGSGSGCEEDVVQLPALLGCVYAAMTCGGIVKSQPIYSVLFGELNGRVCAYFRNLNRHCCQQTESKTTSIESPQTCQCTRMFFRSQMQLNELLLEVERMLWMFLRSYSTCFPTMRIMLRKCIDDFGAAVTELQACPACPAAVQRNANMSLDEDAADSDAVPSSGNAFNDMIIRGDLSKAVNGRQMSGQDSSTGSEFDEQRVHGEGVGAAAWRSVLVDRNRYIHGLLKILKMLTAVVDGVTDSKID